MQTTRAEGFRAWGEEPDGPEWDEFTQLGLRSDIHLSWRRSKQALAPMDKMDVPPPNSTTTTAA